MPHSRVKQEERSRWGCRSKVLRKDALLRTSQEQGRKALYVFGNVAWGSFFLVIASCLATALRRNGLLNGERLIRSDV